MKEQANPITVIALIHCLAALAGFACLLCSIGIFGESARNLLGPSREESHLWFLFSILTGLLGIGLWNRAESARVFSLCLLGLCAILTGLVLCYACISWASPERNWPTHGTDTVGLLVVATAFIVNVSSLVVVVSFGIEFRESDCDGRKGSSSDQ